MDLSEVGAGVLQVKKCHICDVGVPEIYFLQHLASNKHKNYANIAKNAMDRITKHINVMDICITGTNNGSYLCDSCVMVVFNTDKISHENSKSHLLCFERDQLIKNLSKAYINGKDEPFEISEGKPEKIVVNKINAQHLDEPTSLEDKFETPWEMKINTHVSGKDSKIDTDCLNLDCHHTNKKILKYVKDRDDEKKHKQLSDKSSSYLREYIKFVSNKISTLHSIYYLNEIQIGIKTEKGDRIKIPVDNFHSITNCSFVDDNVIKFCKLCRQTLKTYDELEAHKYAVGHIKNIMTPIKDSDSIRRVLNSLWSHCTLCNQLIATKDVYNHLSVQVHINNVKDAVISIENINNEIKRELDREDHIMPNDNQILDENIDDDNNSEKIYIATISEKTQTNGHFTVLDNNFINVKIENGEKVIVHIDNFHSYSSVVNYNDKSTKYCQLCSLYLESHEKENHKYDMEHIYNITLPLKDDNCIRGINSNWSHCLLCNDRMEITDIDKHISTLRHRQRKETAVLYLNKDNQVNNIASSENQVISENKVTNILNQNDELNVSNASSEKEFIKGNLIKYVNVINEKVKHKHCVRTLDEKYIEIKAVNGDIVKVNIDHFHGYLNSVSNYIYCYVCSKALLGAEIEEHKYETEHINKIISPIYDLHCIREFVNDFHCILCNLKINKADYKTHIESPYHCDFLKKAISVPKNPISEKRSRIKTISNKEIESCDFCDLKILTHDLIAHVECNKHKIQKNRTEDHSSILNNCANSIGKVNSKMALVYHCDVCNISIDTHDMASHINEDRHKLNVIATKNAELNSIVFMKKIKTTHYQIKHSVKSNHLTCIVCKVNVGHNDKNINNHINGSYHKKQHKLVLDLNKLVPDGHGYVCHVCKIHVTLTKELYHINSKYHESNLKSASISHAVCSVKTNKKASFCELCNVVMARNSMAAHILGRRHIETYKRKQMGNRPSHFQK